MLPTDLTSLKAYEKNNLKHSKEQIQLIADSIREHGFTQPIVIDSDSNIVCGHARVEAAKLLELKKVPCISVAHLSDVQIKALRLIDNQLARMGKWDMDSVQIELDELQESDFDIEKWTLDELRIALDADEEQGEEDEYAGGVPGEDDDSGLTAGDVIHLNEHRLVCGDCTQFSVLPPEDISLILTDPPYGVNYVGKTEDEMTVENDNLDQESLAHLFEESLKAVWDLLKDGTPIYVTCPSGPIGLVFERVLNSLDALRQRLVWVKDHFVLGHSDYHYEHEPILYGWKPGARAYFTKARNRSSVMHYARPTASRIHPTMKPIPLWCHLIKNSTKKGDWVYDPFMGSGTTIIAADQIGRKAAGFEISPAYCDVIINRFRGYCEKAKKDCTITVNGEPYAKDS